MKRINYVSAHQLCAIYMLMELPHTHMVCIAGYKPISDCWICTADFKLPIVHARVFQTIGKER